MPARIVEGQLPYTGGTGIEIDANKVISLLLREENNLILVNSDNEIYTDLQFASGLTPNSDFPVGVTVGKVLQSDGWTQSGLVLNWKTTSGDYARWIYANDGKLYFDNGTGTWKQVYYASEVDILLNNLQHQIDVLSGLGKFLSLWDCAGGEPMSFPLDIPYAYSTGDYFLVGNVSSATPPVNYRPDGSSWSGTASTTVETHTVAIGDVYIYDGTVWLLQKNQEAGGGGTGDVTGPAFATDGHVALFDGATGKVIRDGGVLPTQVTVVDALNSTSTTSALSANQGKVLDEKMAGQMKYPDFYFDAQTGATVTLSLSTSITPSANFTVNAPSTIKDGQVYLLMVDNGATAYTMTLGTGIVNYQGADTTLTANASDLFVFLANDGMLELQKEMSDGVVASAVAPANPTEGMLWYDTANDVLKVYDGSNWNALGTGNGDVVGPASATNGNLAVFDGITGKLIKDGGAIPTVNDGTLTITQNGTSAGTFTANQSTATTIALTDTTYTAGTNIQISAGNVISATNTVDNTPYTQSEYDALPSSKESDHTWRVLYDPYYNDVYHGISSNY